ncbi:MAG TPA: succinate dehydrogenase, hydrophobic membrane anchor protein [Sphingomonadaceae bacterium]|nr:succinate dehydrogenase, hydrophobic membrane anchor protein [Sphingomonadaceae bacterium]
MNEQTAMAQVRGLGPAKEGAHHWTVQRYTALGNLFLGSWLAVSLALMPQFTYSAIAGWLSDPVPSIAMALLIVSTFWHARLGLQVLVEDYVHDAGTKWAVLALVNMAAIAGMVTGLYFLLRVVIFAISQEATAAMLAQAMGGMR